MTSAAAVPDNAPILAPVFPPGDTLRLSNAALKNYMICPRLFYYRQVLFLPPPGQPALSLGLLVHRLLEWLNTTYEPGNPELGYHAARLQQQIERIFVPLETLADDPARQAHVVACGLKEADWKLMAPLGPLGWAAFAEETLAAVSDMAARGYFARYGQPRQIVAEAGFEMPAPFWSTQDHPVVLSGYIDALIQDEAGHWHIVDYKRFGSGVFATKPETCRAQFLTRLLTPLQDTAGFDERLNSAYPVDYQLPLYWLAFQQSDTLAAFRAGGPLRDLSIQLIRPAFASNPDQGAIELSVEASVLADAMPALTEEIRERIIQPLGQATHFAIRPGPACARCAYAAICEGPAMAGLMETEENA
ncbi:MAG: PD-(D/E)XK nuclease family protein [Candidatus Melainabacteria bacterium]